MKQVVAVLAVFGAVAFFAANADAQCYGSGFNSGFYGGTTVYRPAGNFYYQARPVYNNYRVPNYYNQRVYYGGNFHRHGGHIHRHGYPGNYYRGGSGFYYRGGNVGVRVRF